jgi:hypothetical protein
MFIAPVLASAARRAGAAILGGAVLWAVAREAGPRDCLVVIHAREEDLEVRADGWACPREADPYSPIVCELRPGRHTMSARRGGRTVHEESFDLGPGDDLVLTALDDARYEAEHSSKIRAVRPDGTPGTARSPRR